ncbi:hypothetical protein JCM10908_001587 [Rhodotorula pacifica]|uniref:ubiquitin ligase complex subunit HRD3 n=1 Tax=Rhodotorula pacifica TaxID=1495444 RepID=UPI00317B765F
MKWSSTACTLLSVSYFVNAQQQLPARADPEQQQITFGVSQGARIVHGKAAEGQRGRDERDPTGSPSDDAPSLADTASEVLPTQSRNASEAANDLYQLALSLLDSLTAHSPLPPPTPYSFHLAANASGFDRIQARLDGKVTGSVLKRARKVAGAVASTGGSLLGRKQQQHHRSDTTTVQYLIERLKYAIEQLGARSGTAGRAQKASSGGARAGGKEREGKLSGWKEKLQASALKGDVVLTWGEVQEAWTEVLALAEEAAAAGSAEALLLLGDIYLGGASGLEPNPAKAVEYYTQASELHGSGDAQYKLGYLYGSNYGSAMGGLEGDGHQGSALLHYTFAALSGHVPASMTVGYRHWAGIGTKQSCKDALGWYKAAADAAIRSFNAGPPGGRHLPPPKIRLSDLEGGPYGPGASSVRPALTTGGSNAQTQQEWDDLIEYHLFHAEHGDVSYQYRLGRLYYQGFGAGGLGGARDAKRGRLQPTKVGAGPADGLWDGGRDFHRASKWFLRVARRLWPSDPREATWDPAQGPIATRTKTGAVPRVGYFDPTKDRKNEKLDQHSTLVAGLAAGFLGRMYLRGEGLPVNYAKAHLWFARGQKQGDRESNNGLGIMYRDGLGVERDLKKANMLFHAAAQQDLAEAQVNLGKFHFGMGDFVLANTYFEHAIRADSMRSPDTFQAYYYLAELAARSSTDSCPVAVSFYKRVAERGDWDHEVWWEAERARERGDLRTALLGYWMMAERGYEVAQSNVAWILDQDKKRLRVPLLDASPAKVSPAVRQLDRLALTYWTRSAAQDNVDALVKMGDYYYAGLGTEDGVPQMEKAAGCYQSAATTRFSAMAMWNLGWMHEVGKGVPQDFHLAKRNYDMALETSSDAFFPSTLSLIGLYARALYHAITKSGDDELRALSLFGRDPDPDGVGAGFAEHGMWSFARAWRDIQRNWGVDPGPEPDALHLHGEDAIVDGVPAVGGAAGAEGGDQAADGQRAARRALEGGENPVEWEGYRPRGNPREGGEEDEFYLEDEGDFGGTVAIVALSMLLAWLLYFRHRPEHRQAMHAPGVPPPAAPAQAPQPPPAPPAPQTTAAPPPSALTPTTPADTATERLNGQTEDRERDIQEPR